MLTQLTGFTFSVKDRFTSLKLLEPRQFFVVAFSSVGNVYYGCFMYLATGLTN